MRQEVTTVRYVRRDVVFGPHHAVVADRRPRRARGRGEAVLDVVGLPGERRVAHVDVGGLDAVNAPALVVPSIEGETVEHLDFVPTADVDAAVAPALSPGKRFEAETELDVERVVAEELLGRCSLPEQVALDDLAALPGVDARAVEQDDRILGGLLPEGRTLADDSLEGELRSLGRLSLQLSVADLRAPFLPGDRGRALGLETCLLVPAVAGPPTTPR